MKTNAILLVSEAGSEDTELLLFLLWLLMMLAIELSLAVAC